VHLKPGLAVLEAYKLSFRLQHDRKEVLLKALNSIEGIVAAEDLNLENFASKTEGYTFRDLMDLIDKAIFVCLKKGEVPGP